MIEPSTEHDATEDAVVMARSGSVNDVTLTTHGLAKPTTPDQVAPAGEVTCEALQLALTALHIDIAWHAGVMSAEASMEALDREVGRTTSRYNRSTQASAPEVVRRAPSHKTAGRVVGLGREAEYDPM
jgi:methylphosphotriester-DNA--protein-cysteine methyltransferase